MNKKYINSLILVFTFGLGLGGGATYYYLNKNSKNLDIISNNGINIVKEELAKNDYTLTEIYTTPVNNLFLIVGKDNKMGMTNKLLSTGDGRFIFENYFDLQERKLASDSLFISIDNEDNKDTKEIIKSLNYDNLFSVKKGDGSRKLLVVTDPDCPYCKKIETEIEKLNNVEVFYLYFPLRTIHPDAERKINLLWNVEPENRYKVFNEYNKTGKLPENSKTNYKYDYEYAENLLKMLNVHGTPFSLNLSNGSVRGGVMSLDSLEEFLSFKENSNTSIKKIYPK